MIQLLLPSGVSIRTKHMKAKSIGLEKQLSISLAWIVVRRLNEQRKRLINEYR